MSYKKAERQPIDNIIATFTTSSQVGPESWDVFPVSKEFPSTTTLKEVAEWFFREEPIGLRARNIHLSQPEPREVPTERKKGNSPLTAKDIRCHEANVF